MPEASSLHLSGRSAEDGTVSVWPAWEVREEGVDPVLAVMHATGHSRRRTLRLIAQARDAGYLTPRHARR